MKIWFDTEFIDNGKQIYPISIGMIREDQKTYYAEFDKVPWKKAHLWVIENVKSKLTGPKLPKNVIAQEIIDFVGPKPEFWGYFADYDWVVLCQLYGPMINVPLGWPHYCLDLMQIQYHVGVRIIQPEKGAHNALTDAIWTRNCYYGLMDNFFIVNQNQRK